MMKEVLTLSPTEVRELSSGINCVSKTGFSLLVLKRGDGTLQACENLCKHQGGKFAPSTDIEDMGTNIVKCTRHHWKLDCETLEYVNPPEVHKQEPLHIEYGRDGSATFLKKIAASPWREGLPRTKLNSNEMTITYLSHACLEFKLGQHVIVSDPWLTGPAFLRGWWLKHKPPENAIERVCNADAIWISHGHSDHLNIHTLRLVAARRPDIPIFVGKLHEPIIPQDMIEDIGLTNVNIIPTGEWYYFDENSRFMINTDDTLPEVDTWVIMEHKGHRIINFVDCSAPSAFNVPDEQVDVILTDFASGASGFPSCFADMYGREKVLQLADEKRRLFLRKLGDLAKLTRTKAYIPTAGYFTPSHPSDTDILKLNRQNSPKEAVMFLKKIRPQVKTWIPFPGGRFDLCTLEGDEAPDENAYTCKSWNFSSYTSQIESIAERAMTTHEQIQQYFDWVGFANYDLVLHVVEMDEKLKRTLREFFIDFGSETPQVVTGKPRPGNYLCMRVRSTSFRYVLHTGSSWDDLLIGFQARISVSPDVYHFKFYNHFSNLLPRNKPQFKLSASANKCQQVTSKFISLLVHAFILVIAVIYAMPR